MNTRHKITINGEEMPLYTIGVLADAIGRNSQTLRKWEVAGTIPKTMFKAKGIRLYSQEQIDIVVKHAERYQITQGKSIGNTNFSAYVFRDWGELFKKYSNKTEPKAEQE